MPAVFVAVRDFSNVDGQRRPLTVAGGGDTGEEGTEELPVTDPSVGRFLWRFPDEA